MKKILDTVKTAAKTASAWTAAKVKAAADMEFFPATPAQFRYIVGLNQDVDAGAMFADVAETAEDKALASLVTSCIDAGLTPKALAMKGLLSMSAAQDVIDILSECKKRGRYVRDVKQRADKPEQRRKHFGR